MWNGIWITRNGSRILSFDRLRHGSIKLLILVFILVMGIGWGETNQAHADQNLSYVQDTLRQLEKELQIDFVMDPPLPKSDAKNLPPIVYKRANSRDYRQLARYLALFQKEIRKYPHTFFRDFGLKKIVFVKSLFFKETPAQGLYNSFNRYMFFNFKDSRGGRLALQRNIHHEIYHMLHTARSEWNPEQWKTYNQPDFKYAKVGVVLWNRERNDVNYFAPKQLGFVTNYAMTSVEEDQAEVYASLFVESQSKLIHKWAERDPILKQKIQHIKTFLATISDNSMDENFWSNLYK